MSPQLLLNKICPYHKHSDPGPFASLLNVPSNGVIAQNRRKGLLETDVQEDGQHKDRCKMRHFQVPCGEQSCTQDTDPTAIVTMVFSYTQCLLQTTKTSELIPPGRFSNP